MNTKSDAAQQAIETLLEIAKDEARDADTRIRAACAILGSLDNIHIPSDIPVPA